ncbi:MAG: hypothetical protein ACTSP5_01820 [Candidatus Heimdallarchaeota archaeon]
MSELRDKIIDSTLKLEQWIASNGWAGYDPYDIQCAYFLHKFAGKNKLMKFLHARLFRFFNRTPKASRKFLRIKPQVNAKGMGLFTSAYCSLYNTFKDEKYLEKAKFIADWLIKNTNPNYEGACWGYPFSWQNIIFNPRGTPSGVVSSAVGHGLWDLYQITKEKKYLDVCELICLFFLNSLNRTENKNGLIFSYTPLDNFQVHNASLFVAEFLIRIGKTLNRKGWVNLGLKAINFTLKEQNEDGSIYYWNEKQAEELGISLRTDHYHSGFEMRMLYNSWKNTGKTEIKDGLDSYYAFYEKTFFDKEYAPVDFINGITTDVHTCAEALILNSTFYNLFNYSKEILPKTIPWIIENMQTSEGWFRYTFTRKKKKNKTINIPYLRWGQAWMLLGLSKALEMIE